MAAAHSLSRDGQGLHVAAKQVGVAVTWVALFWPQYELLPGKLFKCERRPEQNKRRGQMQAGIALFGGLAVVYKQALVYVRCCRHKQQNKR